jgi:predicted transcriptional regulator
VQSLSVGGHLVDKADAIISIHPGYAEAILGGVKTVELRRKLPEIGSGTRLWVYATRPTGSVVGFATVRHVERAPPETIWTKHRTNIGVDEATFQKYFNGASEAIAILLSAARRIRTINMDQLRRIRGAGAVRDVVGIEGGVVSG